MDRRRFLTATAAALPLLHCSSEAMEESGKGEQEASELKLGGSRVITGADWLAATNWRSLTGRKVGVVTNPTGVLSDKRHIVDAMVASGKVNVVAVFGPEHGFRGTAQAGGSEGEYTDPRTGLRVYDAYGISASKLAEFYRKAGVDTVVFDIADVGARFYTYIWTLYTAMQAAVAAGASVVVLDRPNPVGGQAFGPQLDPRFSSGVGRKPIVQQHGLTAGELARFYDAEFLPADAGGRVSNLEIVPVRGWRRGSTFHDTGLDWVPPSPNMPTADTALVYPGNCLFEGTELSEGRGTTRPFETIGAPNIDWRWAERLNESGLRGIQFRETYFVPTFNKFQGTLCGGVQLHVTDRATFEPIRTAVAMLVSVKQLFPSVFAWRPDKFVDKLFGSDRLRTMIDAGARADDVIDAWQAELSAFRKQRAPYLLYG